MTAEADGKLQQLVTEYDQAMREAAPVPTIAPEADSKLEQLLAQYDEAKAAADAAEKRLKALKAEIKVEAAAVAPGHDKMLLTSRYLNQTLELRYRTSWRLDSTRLKRDHPRTWVEYAYESGSWYLQAAK